MTGRHVLSGIHSAMASIISRCVCFSFTITRLIIEDCSKILCVDWNCMKERAGSVEVEAMLSRTAPIFNGDIRSHERVSKTPFRY